MWETSIMEITAEKHVHFSFPMPRVLSLLLLLGVAAGFQAAPLLRPALQAAVSRCAADSIQVRAALFSKTAALWKALYSGRLHFALTSGGAGAVGSALCI
jgi:hypothetical protein